MKKVWFAGGFLVFLVVIGGYFSWKKMEPQAIRHTIQGNGESSELERTWVNYAHRIRPYAEKHDVPLAYLLALTSLETSGFYPPKSRFEKGVLARLKAVKSGSRRSYEQVKSKHLKELNDDGLRNLATSWGPFQLMGYKCIGLGVHLHEIRDDGAIEHGVAWINQEYGRFLRKRRFSDAFHIHNTGRKLPRNKVPQTHDPRYIERGLAYITFFEKKIQEETGG